MSTGTIDRGDHLIPTCPINGCGLAYEYDGRKLSRAIGHVVRGVHDGVLYWQCPFCRATWHRWPEGHPLRKRAFIYVGPP